jgi:hypothetical protein
MIDQLLKPRTVIFLQGKGFIEQAILECQNIYVREKFNVDSQWSHVGIIVDDGLYYDSTISFHGWNYTQGIRAGDPFKIFFEKELSKNYNRIAFQNDFKLNNTDWKKITAYCQNAYKNKLNYGTLELFGTLYTLLCWKFARTEKQRKKILSKQNIFDSPQDVYCSAFVTDAIEHSGKNYIDPESSISTVDELYLNSKIKNNITEVKL